MYFDVRKGQDTRTNNQQMSLGKCGKSNKQHYKHCTRNHKLDPKFAKVSNYEKQPQSIVITPSMAF